MRLPDPNGNPTDIVRYIDLAMVTDSAADYRRRKCMIDWDSAMQFVFGEQYPENLPIDDNGKIRVVCNRIVRCVMSMMVLQAGDPAVVSFVSRETGEPSRYFLRQPVQPGLSPDAPPPPSVEIDEATAMQVKQQFQMQQAMVMQQSAATGLPPIMPTNNLIEINDQTCCEALQTVHDGMDEEIGWNFIFRENVYYKLIFGTAPTSYEFDSEQMQHVIVNGPPTHYFFQRLIADQNRNPYSVYDEFCSSDDALAVAAMVMPPDEFKAIEAEIERLWREGSPQLPGSSVYPKSSMFNQVFKMSGGFIRRAFIRNRPYPMTVNEALESGKVVPCAYDANTGQKIPQPQPQQQTAQPLAANSEYQLDGTDSAFGGGSDQQDAYGNSVVYQGPPDVAGAIRGQDAGDNGIGGHAADPEAPYPQLKAPIQPRPGGLDQFDQGIDAASASRANDPDSLNEYMLDVPQPPPQIRQGYCLAAQPDVEVTPPDLQGNQTHPLWPMTLAIRQVLIIGNTRISDKRCRFKTMPVVWNTNVPIPFSPLGMGEPKILRDLQKAVNRILSDLISWAAHNAVPPEMILKSIVDKLDEPFRKARTRYGQRIPVPMELIPAGWKLADVQYNIPVPPIPPDLWKMIDFLIQLIDKEGNQADVAQGNASPSWSGEAIQSLQNAHNNTVKASGLSTEDWFRQLTRLKVESITHIMTPRDCWKRCRKYPIEVWQVMHKRFPNLDPIIAVEIDAASGQSRNAQVQQLIAAKQAGAPISGRTIANKLKVDPDEEFQNLAEESRQQAETNPQPQPAANGNGNGGGRMQEQHA